MRRVQHKAVQGDIRQPQDALNMIRHTKCSGVMIARGALSRPWIFREIWSLQTTGQLPPPPTIAEKCQLMRDHFNNLIRFRCERVAVLEFRKRVSWYAKEMNPCRILRDPMRAINCQADFEEVMARFLDWRLAYDEAVAAGNRVEDDCLVA